MIDITETTTLDDRENYEQFVRAMAAVAEKGEHAQEGARADRN